MLKAVGCKGVILVGGVEPQPCAYDILWPEQALVRHVPACLPACLQRHAPAVQASWNAATKDLWTTPTRRSA